MRALLPLLLLTACAGPPVQEMSDARQALQAAEQADAHKKAPESYRAARRLLGGAGLRGRRSRLTGCP